jgi:hypothetical protein
LPSQKIKIEIRDEEGNKINVSFEGRINRNKVLQLLDFVELLSGSSPDLPQDRTITNLSKIEKLQLIIKDHFAFHKFTTQAALTAYEDDLKEPIALSTVSMYLTRLSDRGYLIRSGTRYRRQYRMNRPSLIPTQRTKTPILP